MAIAALSGAAAHRSDHASVLGRRATLVAVLAAAVAVRLWHLGARSLWTDEGSTWTAATAPLRELIRLCAEKDASPPFFYLLTSLAMRLGRIRTSHSARGPASARPNAGSSRNRP